MSTVGERILRRRKELNLTQEELARLMGYKSKSTINKIEMGINDIPQSKIILFAEVLCTTPSYLMGWDEEEKNPPAGSPDLTDRERSLLDLFKKVPKDKQQLVFQMIEVALKTN